MQTLGRLLNFDVCVCLFALHADNRTVALLRCLCLFFVPHAEHRTVALLRWQMLPVSITDLMYGFPPDIVSLIENKANIYGTILNHQRAGNYPSVIDDSNIVGMSLSVWRGRLWFIDASITGSIAIYRQEYKKKSFNLKLNLKRLNSHLDKNNQT